MSKRSLLFLLVFWNVLLTGALVWALARNRVPQHVLEERLSTINAADSMVVPQAADTLAVPEGRIAYFFMDSVQTRYELVKESADRVRSEGQRLENQLQREMQKAEARYNELMAKDHTYSTQAELKADQDELAQLGDKIQQMRSNSQDQIDRLQNQVLQDITEKIQKFLEAYNEKAGYDYIFSIQSGGQIWVGNKGLDITPAVVAGLNARHRESKAAAK